MSVFADSSAVVKLYADEAGHREIRALTTMAVSELARVEVPAALWRKHRMGQLSVASASILVRAFEADYSPGGGGDTVLIPLAVSSILLEKAAALTSAHGLRAYDAVQLSTALAARVADPECSVFAAFDDQLREAAAKSGFELLPGS
ncbi:type II toxin-antitoxin system VapC family toxin [Parafrigoribacterium humi]|uniref:type II toxin-antitoxin system VapC family toxin n=1 Tax=Parafrigoribacterium humi TaxID=3144664 RepID=UPI0032EF1125